MRINWERNIGDKFMAIESVKINNAATSLSNRLDKPQNNSALDINNIEKRDIREVEKDDKVEKKEDKIILSEDALTQLRETENLNDRFQVREISKEDLETLKDTQKSLERNIIEFRGFSEISKRRDLTAEDFSKISSLREEIKTSVGDNDIPDNKILEKADDIISGLANQASDLLDNLNKGRITGNEFDKLDKINVSLNKANGFGKTFEPELNVRDTSEIRRSFLKSLEDIGDRKLTQRETSLLQQVQKELSTIEGFRVNVQDRELVGSDGLVA